MRTTKPEPRLDPVSVELARNLFASITEEMGQSLMRSAFSANIKERRDYSCGLFDASGRAVALGDHMPVHLGSLPRTVEEVLRVCPPRAGEMIAVNDPHSGGTHLPDITLVAPYPSLAHRARFFLANRAHHSDVGGAHAGSMAPGAREIFEEGIVMPPIRLVRRGEPNPDLLAFFLANVRGRREREADLRAQIAANHAGARRMKELEERQGRAVVSRWARAQIDYAARVVRAFLREIPAGTYRAEEFLEGDGIETRPVRLRVEIRVRGGRVEVDFRGTDPATAGNINAVESVTRSAVCYVFRCLVREEIPYNAGCFEALTVRIPPGTVLSARWPAAVAGGNVETSQRVVDLVLRALERALPDRIPAQSSGTMSNLSFGGEDPKTGLRFGYYETVAGGMGASPSGPGLSGVHTHMTNSMNTPVEALEQVFPVQVVQYSLRAGSGGKGEHRGGDGIVRELRLRIPGEMALFAERHRLAPRGIRGGGPGKAGKAWIVRGGTRRRIPAKATLRLASGDSLRLATPGGGGWGPPGRGSLQSRFSSRSRRGVSRESRRAR